MPYLNISFLKKIIIKGILTKKFKRGKERVKEAVSRAKFCKGNDKSRPRTYLINKKEKGNDRSSEKRLYKNIINV